MLLMGNVVLITGGCGSLGRALTRRLLKTDVESIRIFDHWEYGHYEMRQEFTDPRLRYFIGDVRDFRRLHRAMTDVDIIFHTAALKHVDLCEYNPIEAVKTNVEGLYNVIDAAIDNRVEKVLNVSSDKSVHPINLYGVTKLVAEKLTTGANIYGDTKFSSVRFGNFEASSGSFLGLLLNSKPEDEIPVTDKEMTRFWITLPNAADFCIKCVDMMQGGEIFIPKMPEKNLMETIEAFKPMAKIKVIGKKKGRSYTKCCTQRAKN